MTWNKKTHHIKKTFFVCNLVSSFFVFSAMELFFLHLNSLSTLLFGLQFCVFWAMGLFFSHLILYQLCQLSVGSHFFLPNLNWVQQLQKVEMYAEHRTHPALSAFSLSGDVFPCKGRVHQFWHGYFSMVAPRQSGTWNHLKLLCQNCGLAIQILKLFLRPPKS